MTTKDTKLFEVIDMAIAEALAGTHTSTVAIITGVNEKTINCQVSISRNFKGEKKDFPEFIEVPVIFMHGGGSYTAYPVAVGDSCLLIFCERAFDNWYAGTNNVLPPEYRMHDYSDGFALVGINNLQNAISIPDVITQVGDAFYQGNHEHSGDNSQTGNFSLTGNIDHTGNTTTSGTTDSGTYSVGGTPGASGTFISKDDKTVVVQNGLVISIS